MHDAVEYERRGVPTVTLAHDRFASAARAQARIMGMPDLPIVVVSQEVYNHGNPAEVEKAAEAVYPQVIEVLTQALKPARV